MFGAPPDARPGIPVAYEELVVSVAAVGFQNLPAGLIRTEVKVSGGPVSIRLSGLPTDTIGVPALEGEALVLTAHEAARLRAIRTGAVDGLLRATHYALS